MSTAPYAPTGYPVTDQTQGKLASASKAVKNTFDTFAVIILVLGALTFVGLILGAAIEHDSYVNDYDNYTNETGALIVAAFITLPYTAFLWASVKFYAVVAGYIHWRTK